MKWQLPFQSGRQPVLARNLVSTSQPLASQAGAAAFARGGNAIDAALAAAITLTVVEPTMNGIGGDGFAIVWDGKDATNKPAPPGLYRLSATAVVNGQTSKVPVNTLSTVRSIATNPTDGSVSVEVDGGKTVLLTDVKRVGI